jgi:ferredoxin-NADP reductase
VVEHEVLLRVASRREVAERVIELTLQPLDNQTPLPAWQPGAHIDLMLAGGLVRQYSLCGDPSDTTSWRIAVLHEPDGRGGSAFVHQRLRCDETVRARGPRNHFPLRGGSRLLFIAGGIGITPILPMVRAADAAGWDWTLHYGGRSRNSMAYLNETEARHPERVCTYSEADDGMIDIATLLGPARTDTLVYCCGPEGLLAAVESRCSSWPTGSLHVERFAAAVPSITAENDTAFEVEFAESGVTAVVDPGRSIVEVAEDHGIAVISSCEEGICGTCETKVLGGQPDHRDSVLTDHEKAAGDTMMICVSRCHSARLRLNL